MGAVYENWRFVRQLWFLMSFDTRRAVSLLESHGLRPPGLRDYVGPMVSFFKQHENDPAYAPRRG